MGTDLLLGDLIDNGEQLVIATGVEGLGNAHYLSNRNRAPEKFTEGKTGRARAAAGAQAAGRSGAGGASTPAKALISVLSAAAQMLKPSTRF